MRFEIGQTVWLATFEARETSIECGDCAGTGRLRVLFADDTMVSIECAGCQRGYDPPTGRLVVYDREPRATCTVITGVEVTDSKTEWRTSAHYIGHDENVFDNEADCLARAKELAAEHDRDERERMNQKEKPARTWAWHAHYHRREIRECERRIEHHKAKLAVANLKAKAEKPALIRSK